MPSCIECPRKHYFATPKALMIHLQKVHKFNLLSSYRCGERGCQRKYSNAKAFVRHIKLHKSSDDDFQNSVNESRAEPRANVSNVCEDVCDSDSNPDLINCEQDQDVSFSPQSFQSSLKKQADAFVCKYYGKPSLPRNIVQNLVDDIQLFLSDGSAMNTLKETVMSALGSCGAEPSVVGDISLMFESLQNPFSHLQSEFLRFKHFENSGNFVKPNNFQLGRRLALLRSKNGARYKWVPVSAVHIPLAPVLKKFLELPDSLQCILDYINLLMQHPEPVSNFIQSEVWKRKRLKFNANAIVLPLFVYFDDYQANNNLGPHSLKIGGVYVSIACLPPEIASRLENIFLSILFYSGDRVDFKVEKILEPLLKELKVLEREGIEVLLSSGEAVRVYFILGLLLGDNLGVHQLCGFVACFAFANYPCRFCKVFQTRMQYDIQEDRSLMRNVQNYEEDLLIGDESRTGIKEKCAINDVESFHITENLEADILHDFDEGILHNITTCILLALTKQTKEQKAVFTMKTLNRRLQLFNFGTHSSLYQTKMCVTADDLSKGKLKTTGSEMQCFVRNFGVLMGDLVPECNEHWKLYLCLQHVLDIVCAKSLSKSTITSLKFYVHELGRQYVALGNTLTFKFHKILWHYAHIIEQSGPVVHLSTRRYESKHRQSKLGLYSNMSRVHACWSASMKHQLTLCHRFVANKSVLPDVETGSGSVLSPDDMKAFNQYSLQDILPDMSSVFMPVWIDYKGSRFDNTSTVILDIDSEFGWPVFGEIESMFVCNNSVALLCRKLETLGFHEHLHAYEVKRIKQKICANIESLADPLPLNTLRSPGGGLYIVLRYQL